MRFEIHQIYDGRGNSNEKDNDPQYISKGAEIYSFKPFGWLGCWFK
jgi:hypothetical protein